MEKVTDSPLGLKFFRQSSELAAIESKLRRKSLPPSHKEALEAHKRIVGDAINRTLTYLSAPTWAQ